MPYAIELFFDALTESRIRSVWADLATGRATSLAALGSRPHVSLAVSDGTDQLAAMALLDRFANGTGPFPLSFTGVAAFPGERPVTYLAAELTDELEKIHRSFFVKWEAVASGAWDYYRPGNWIPHCTLADGLTALEAGEVLKRGPGFDLPLDGTVVEIGLVEFRPVRLIHSVALSGIVSPPP